MWRYCTFLVVYTELYILVKVEAEHDNAYTYLTCSLKPCFMLELQNMCNIRMVGRNIIVNHYETYLQLTRDMFSYIKFETNI
jgi:hypothetical protein